MSKTPITVALVGAGHRSRLYGSYALKHPQEMKVVAVAEPDAVRRTRIAGAHQLSPEMQFENYQQMVARPKLADAAINGTMDQLHYESSLALMEAGYHLLLEKPIAPTEEQVRKLVAAASHFDREVMICHVLRYAPFYQRVKQLLVERQIGKIISMRTAENVSYHHMAAAFIRGPWRSERTSNPMMLSKCCHDLDIIAWLLADTDPIRVSSFGSLMHFRHENAPTGSTDRCLNGCHVEPTCQFSARHYVESGLWDEYVWAPIEHLGKPTTEQKIDSLRTSNPYGRCVWRCDNDVVDHQSVLVEFASGATATHDMFTNAARPCRTLHIIGTDGEILGDMEAGTIILRKPNPALRPNRYIEDPIALDVAGDGHGGGDFRLVADFLATLRRDPDAKSVTRIQQSLNGHLIAFAADRAMKEKRVVNL